MRPSRNENGPMVRPRDRGLGPDEMRRTIMDVTLFRPPGGLCLDAGSYPTRVETRSPTRRTGRRRSTLSTSCHRTTTTEVFPTAGPPARPIP